MTTKKAIICDDCKQQLKVTALCFCGMWTCVPSTLSERHDTRIGEHWKMLAKYHNIDTTWPPKELQK